jgi:O-antigen ligase
VIGAAAGFVLVWIILLKPFLGLAAYTIVFVLRPGELYPALAGLHLERILGTVTLVALVAIQIREHRGLQVDRSRQTKLLFLFLLFVAMSVPFAYWRRLAIDGLAEMLRIVAFYTMVVQLVTTRKRLWTFWTIYSLMMLWLGASSLFGYFTGHAFFTMGIDRATGLTDAGGNANQLGASMACSIPFLLAMTFHPSAGRKRLLLASGSVVLILTLALTGSRSSLLGAFAGFAALWKTSSRRVLLGTIGLLALFAGLYVLPQQYKTRYGTMLHRRLDGSSASRVQTWVTGVQMVLARPLTGVGIKCFGAANGAMTGSWLSSHNLYLQVLGETGLVGGAVFFMFLMEMLRLNRRSRDALIGAGRAGDMEFALLRGIFAGFVALMVTGVFGHSLLRRTWYIYAAVDLAILRMCAQQTIAGTLHGHVGNVLPDG